MKFATVSKILLLGLALLLASSSFAATKANLILVNPTKVNGTMLKAGKYVMEWDGSGPNVEVSVMQGKAIVAKLQARLLAIKAPPDQGAAVTTNDADGTAVLTGVQFAGKRFTLDLSESNNSGPSASAK
jgi:hypothetical protein